MHRPPTHDLRRYDAMLATLAAGEYHESPTPTWRTTAPLSPALIADIHAAIHDLRMALLAIGRYLHTTPAYHLEITYRSREVDLYLADYGSAYGGDAIAHPEDFWGIPTPAQVRSARRALAMSIGFRGEVVA